MSDYDLIIVGGGLGGASLAKSMAEHGAHVLVLERETRFKDRIRGEVIFPWGVAELKALGVYQILVDRCARAVPWIDNYFMGEVVAHRDLSNTTPQQAATLNWVHCEMEAVLLEAAAAAGAEIRQGARARGLDPGDRPTVQFEYGNRTQQASARLVVCADGRGSVARKWSKFAVRQQAYGTLVAGVLCEDVPIATDANVWSINPVLGYYVFIAPQSEGRVRAYVWHTRRQDHRQDYRWQGIDDLRRFVEDSVSAGVPPEWYARLKPIGPLATFDGADTWVDHPYKNGVALIGDAAASNDPSFGQGQSLTARDARVLRDQLLVNDDRDRAGHRYAAEHDHYYARVHEFSSWLYQLYYEIGPAADALRSRALPPQMEDPTRIPDVLFSGPEVPLGEIARRRFFAEE